MLDRSVGLCVFMIERCCVIYVLLVVYFVIIVYFLSRFFYEKEKGMFMMVCYDVVFMWPFCYDLCAVGY